MVQAMVAQDQVQRIEPETTVEVIGSDDEAALKLLSLQVAQKNRLEFRYTDRLQHRELYEFMHQDPSHPSPMLVVPMLAGAQTKTTEDIGSDDSCLGLFAFLRPHSSLNTHRLSPQFPAMLKGLRETP